MKLLQRISYNPPEKVCHAADDAKEEEDEEEKIV